MLNQILSYRPSWSPQRASDKYIFVLVSAWILTMIAVPITKWTLGVESIYPLISLSVILQASAVFYVLYSAWGARETLIIAAVIGVITLAAETLGANTGFPFGPYEYTNRLQPSIGQVPILIPIAWFMMVPAAWAVAYQFRQKTALFVLTSALALTAWDLLLDPQMVHWDLWRWEETGAYFGIPLSNFAGWLLVALLLNWIIQPRLAKFPEGLPVRPLLIIYSITWFLEVFGLAFFWGMPGPALIGGLIMGFFVWLGWRPIVKERTGTRAW